MAKKLNKLPGVLSFQRCLLVTDGLFYNELGNGNLSPLWVMRHGIRGTQNINKSSKEGTGGLRQRQTGRSIQYPDDGQRQTRRQCDGSTSALQPARHGYQKSVVRLRSGTERLHR